MQVTQNREVKTNAVNAIQFSISDDASKLFSMLSSALYTDKEKAVCYELGANCYDANPTEPFLIVAPTQLEPQIKFRDYGPGLAEHDVYRLLTVYGASDKTSDNSKIGGYGIGAKSPAAVTDTWTVTSYHKGKGMEFMVFINEQGIPSLTKIREYESGETGLEVTIPVPLNRFNAWKDCLSTAFRYYPVKPIIKNAVVDYKEIKYITAGSNWKLRADAFLNSYNIQCTFINTHRAYNPDISKLETEFKNDAKIMTLLRMPIVVDFDIGELQLSLSRENVQYTKSTIAAIRAKFEIIKTELFDQMEAIFGVAKDGFEFRQSIYTVQDKILGRGAISNSSASKLMMLAINNRYGISNLQDDIKQFKVFFATERNLNSKYEELKMRVYNGSRFQQVKHSSTCFKTYAITARSSYENSVDNFYLRFSIPVMEKIKIILNDVRDTTARVKYNFDNKTHRFALIINKNIFPKEMKPFIIKASSLPKAPRATRAVGVKKAVNVIKSDVYGFRKNSFMKINVDSLSKATKGIAYVTFSNGKDIYSIIDANWDFLKTFLERAGWHVVGVKKDKPVAKGLTSLMDAVKTEFAKYHSQAAVDSVTAKVMVNQIEHTYGGVYNIIKTMAKFRTVHPSVWNDVQTKYSELKAVNNQNWFEYDTYVTLCKYLKVDPFKTDKSFIDNISSTVYDSYEMLQYVGHIGGNDHPMIERYINLVGK